MKNKSAFPPASQQKIAVEYYIRTLSDLNKPIAFFYEWKNDQKCLEASLKQYLIKKLAIVYKEQSEFPRASQQKTATERYLQTSIRLKKRMAFFYYQKNH